MSETTIAPVRLLAQQQQRRHIDGREAARRWVDSVLCDRCGYLRVPDHWLCTCEPSPQARTEAA